MATRKQKAASKRNIKKAQKARWQHKPYKTSRKVGTGRVSVPLDKIRTLI